jgi:prepilin-type N-terminal cleavage/methylation domain-containing protein
METDLAMHGVRKMRCRRVRSLRESSSAGFSLLELMIVLALFLVVAGIGFMALQPALKDARAHHGYEDVLMQLRMARQRAISERKQYIVCFGAAAPAGALTPMGAPTPQSIQMFRWDAGTALSAATQISANTLPSDVQFQALAGLPNNPTTVPDGFGTGTVAMDFDQGVAGGNKQQVMFMPDGSAHDTNGSWNNGIIYIGRATDLYSSRAVTLYGSTGRIRGWRLITSGGGPKWLQQ